jgi:predicted ester cyclase
VRLRCLQSFAPCPDPPFVVPIRPRAIVAEADRAIGEATFTCTHHGPLHSPAGDIPATGKRVNADFVAAYRTAGGKVTSLRIYCICMATWPS